MARGQKTVKQCDEELNALDSRRKELQKARKEAVNRGRYELGEMFQNAFPNGPADAEDADGFFSALVQLVKNHQDEFDMLCDGVVAQEAGDRLDGDEEEQV